MENGLCEQHDADQAASDHEDPESDWTDISVDNFATTKRDTADKRDQDGKRQHYRREKPVERASRQHQPIFAHIYVGYNCRRNRPERLLRVVSCRSALTLIEAHSGELPTPVASVHFGGLQALITQIWGYLLDATCRSVRRHFSIARYRRCHPPKQPYRCFRQYGEAHHRRVAAQP